ncbi:guanylate-binding protein 1-like [Mercenaria mercenaria]|uniref:guanylate-binding protein 1-like n=1 Tax=Mercenaria mercenaria TaxID=6596 RepID=UPI001E1DEED5|nr:guanylate-binding protein 1-like [Mercenaria mercenaria]
MVFVSTSPAQSFFVDWYPKMDNIARELLRTCQNEIKDNLILDDDILDKLEAGGTLKTAHVEEIKAENTNSKKISRFLSILPKRGPDSFSDFIKAIQRDYSFLATTLLERYNEKHENTEKHTGIVEDTKPIHHVDSFSSEMYEDDIKVGLTQVHLSESLLQERQAELLNEPGCLIFTDDKGRLEINGDVLNKISQIDHKLNIVGVCGLYRSGKSYLMNWLAGEKKGFGLGDTVQSETKGIWAWCKQHPDPRKHNQMLLLIDTEGLGDPEKGNPDHDNQLFCLTLLMSSTMVLNIQGVFDYGALEKLAFISMLTENIKVMSGDSQYNDRHVPIVSPHLVICLRDFHLKLERGGRKQTADEYLETNLQTTLKAEHAKFDKIKESIKSYFPKRKCFTVAQPAVGEQLQNIEQLDKCDLRKEFVEDADKLKTYVYGRKPKYICNASKKELDGADFAALVTTYVNALRNGSPIHFEDAFTKTAMQRNKRILSKVLSQFKSDMNNETLPKSKQALQDKFLIAYEQTLKKYRKDSLLFRQDDFEDQATAEMKKHVEGLRVEVSKRCQTDSHEILKSMYKDLFRNAKGKYEEKDGYQLYETDMAKLETDFFQKMTEYDKDELCIALREFKASIHDDKMKIYTTATKRADDERYEMLHEELNKQMQEQMDYAHDRELEMRNKYLQEELKTLRTEYEDLHEQINQKSLCVVM